MPSFEMNKLQAITGVSSVSNAERAGTKSAAEARTSRSAETPARDAGVALEVSGSAPTEAPFNIDRVAEIRSALRDGSYPLVPTEIADAMIAAQLSYEAKK